jgi:hypothetical protein
VNFVAWGRLLRLSLLPTALADIAAGAVWAQGGYRVGGLGIWMLLLASLCVYHGGMALNDWADRAEDARKRPDRPIPSGVIDAGVARAVAFALLLVAPVLAFRVDPLCGFAILGVSVCAAAYDLVGRGPWLGPTLLGLCRAGNLGAGVLLGVRYGDTLLGGVVPLQASLLALPLAYGAYVFCVSRVGRLEDSDEPLGRRPLPWVVAAVLLLGLAVVAPLPTVEFLFGGHLTEGDWPLASWQAKSLAALLVALAAWTPLRIALSTAEWTRASAMKMTGMLLRRLLIFTAAAVVARGSLDGLLVGGAILCGYPISFALRRVFPPS